MSLNFHSLEAHGELCSLPYNVTFEKSYKKENQMQGKFCNDRVSLQNEQQTSCAVIQCLTIGWCTYPPCFINLFSIALEGIANWLTEFVMLCLVYSLTKNKKDVCHLIQQFKVFETKQQGGRSRDEIRKKKAQV